MITFKKYWDTIHHGRSGFDMDNFKSHRQYFILKRQLRNCEKPIIVLNDNWGGKQIPTKILREEDEFEDLTVPAVKSRFYIDISGKSAPLLYWNEDDKSPLPWEDKKHKLNNLGAVVLINGNGYYASWGRIDIQKTLEINKQLKSASDVDLYLGAQSI